MRMVTSSFLLGLLVVVMAVGFGCLPNPGPVGGEGEGEGDGTGTVSWTDNGTSFTASTTAVSAYFVVIGTAPSQIGQIAFTVYAGGGPFGMSNTVSASVIGPTGDGSIPAGTYPCAPGSTFVNAGTEALGAASSGLASGSCSIVVTSNAVNGGPIAGTFTASLIGIAGTGGSAPTDQTITAGTFSYTDAP